jgi:ABC-type nitrate/sulfonate/bicarbonate transport system substrate-binding protein
MMGQEAPLRYLSLAVCLASALPFAAAAETPPAVVKLGMVGRPDNAPFEIAMKRGYARAALMDEGAVKGPADLKGRTIAPGPLPGQYPDLLFHKLLAMGHLNEQDVTVTHLTFPDALAAMAVNTVDAAFMIEPLVRQAEFYKEQGTLSGPIPDIDRYVDASFADAAVKSLGAR